MATKRQTPQKPFHGRWLWTVVMLLGAFCYSHAQTRDVITFTGGAESPDFPGVYVIDMGDADIHTTTFNVTLSRPKGASATREASITLKNMFYQEMEDIVVTFAPGETIKTIELYADVEPSDFYEDDNGNWIETFSWSGNLPALYSVFTTHYAEAEYELLMLKINRTGAQEPRESNYETKLEILQDTNGNDRAYYESNRWGEYMLYRFFLSTDVIVAPDSRYVIDVLSTDHTNLGPDDDDYGMALSHEVELKPINAGSICSQVWYLYRPSEDEYLHSIPENITPYTGRTVNYPVLEVGPFEVANPTDDAIKYIFYSREDLPEGSTNAVCPIGVEQDRFIPHFSNINIDKTSYKSGEIMTITATMDNWKFVQRAQREKFRYSFGVTLDNNQTVEPHRYTFDEQTGQVTCYVTAPIVTTPTNIYVDFGPVIRHIGVGLGTYSDVLTGIDGCFKVTVSPEPTTPKPITQMDFANLPEDGSVITLEGSIGWFGSLIVDNKVFYLDMDYTPIDATDANQITFTVTPTDGSQAEFRNDDVFSSANAPIFDTGFRNGGAIVTASTPSGITVSRTYQILGVDKNELPSYPEPMNHADHYYVGTAFPKFQFEMNYDGSWPIDDEVTVNYTHANGIQWTETYSLKNLKRHETERGSICYEMPFSFTDEHPDATDDSQLGNTVITAEVLLTMPTTEGPRKTIKCMSSLISDLKKPSFPDYSEMTKYYNDAKPVTFNSEVMYLPLKGFTVGYEIPELGIKETYNNKSGDPVPDWLELEESDYYCRANITVHPIPDQSISRYTFYTLAQRSYNPDEVMVRELTTLANLTYAGPEGHIVFRINGQDVQGDMTFDNSSNVEELIQTRLIPTGFMPRGNVAFYQSEFTDLIYQTYGMFCIYDDLFDGADVTLSCEGEVIQRMTRFNGYFSFLPPSDGRTYKIEVYYPGYGTRYNSTFVSHPFTNIYKVNLTLVGNSDIQPLCYDVLRYYDEGTPWDIMFEGILDGYLYIDNPGNFYTYYKNKYNGTSLPAVRLDLKEWLTPVNYNIAPEMKLRGSAWSFSMTNGYNTPELLLNTFLNSYIHFTPWTNSLWCHFTDEDLRNGSTIVNVVNSQGEPITNASVKYASVDNTLSKQGPIGSAGYDANLEGYQIETDPDQYIELIEVVADGYQTAFIPMYLRDYDYTSRENKGKVRRQVVVMDDNDNQLKNLTLETIKRSGNLKDNKMQAAINYDNLLMIDKSETLNFSQTADYETVIKYMNDGKFGIDGWNGTKYAHLTGYMSCDANYDPSHLRIEGQSLQLQPIGNTKIFSNQEFTNFSQSYCLFEFDLTDQISANATVHPVLKDGSTIVAELPSLHNHTIDLMELNEANNIELPNEMMDLKQIDDEASANGINMKDSGKAFDKFNFELPPVLPFTVNIERDGDHFLVRAICERNFIPGGAVMDAIHKLDDLKYFDEQYQACMDAVNSAKPMDDDFFNDIPRFPSAFCGIKAFLSGIGYINPQTGKLDINFYDGGLTFEASARAQASVSFGIGGFGMSIDAKIASTMMLVNRAAANGQVASLPKIDFVIDNQCRLKVCAWAQAGIDIWIAKAVAGIRGGACVNLQTRSIIPTYGEAHHSGSKISLQAKMEAFAEVRFLFFKKKKTWSIFNYKKEILKPNNSGNPLHNDYNNGIFSISRRNVTKGYKKLKRKVIANLGTPVISNVSGMARPTYLFEGNSLLFNNLKTASDYNDDRLQIYSDGNKQDFVDTGIEAPMYDFSESRNSYMEVVAFEQLSEPIDGGAINNMPETEQTKTASEKSQIKMVWRARPDLNEEMSEWSTFDVCDTWGNIACINPVVAVAPVGIDFEKMSRGAVVWQQGLVKFNDDGDRYIDGSLMLNRYRRYNYSGSEPVEIKRLNRRNVPTDYQVAVKDDSVLVMMTLQQDVNNQDKAATVVYLSVSPDNKVREHYTQVEGIKPQMVSVGSANLVGYLKPAEDGRDLVLTTVNMKGEPTGKISGSLGMNRRMINDYKLVVEDGASADLYNVALLWSQSDEEQTDNGDGTVTVTYKNRIFASKLCSHNHLLYFSAPIEIATMPDDVNLVSMDGYLDGLNLKVAYCVANDDEGAAVLETNVSFTNEIDHKITFNPYDVTDDQQIPITITVVNNGYNPISEINIGFGSTSSSHNVELMPQETIQITDYYPVTENFDGSIDYNVSATFFTANSNILRIGHRNAAKGPQKVQQSGTQTDVRQVDMAVKLVSKRTVGNLTTIVAEVNNASLLPLASRTKCKVGLYASPIANEKAEGTTEVTLDYSDLYDATEHKNKVKIVSLTAESSNFAQNLYLRTTPMKGSEILTDVRLSNNVLPISIKGKYVRGDVNNDGKINISDVSALINIILGKDSVEPYIYSHVAADINSDNLITVSDVSALIKMLLGN